MIYDRDTRELKTDDGKLLKKLDCPLYKQWSQLKMIPGDATKRHCESCKKSVVDLQGMSDEDVEHLFQQSPKCCVYIAPNSSFLKQEQRWRGQRLQNRPDPCPARRILTAKGEQEINEGVQKGFWPLIKRVDTALNSTQWRAVYQNGETGEVKAIGDNRWTMLSPWKRIITPLDFYHDFRKNHFVEAYLLPPDLEIGERVFLDQVITSGPACAYAVWDGTDFKIDELFIPWRAMG